MNDMELADVFEDNWRTIAEFFVSRNWPDTALGRAAADLNTNAPQIVAALRRADLAQTEIKEYQAKHTAIMREADRRYDELVQDIEQGFMQGAYARLKSLQNAERQLELAQSRIAELEKAINTPEIEDFLRGVRLESAHQIERWGSAHDREKSAENWYWLVGYLGGKALRSAITGDRDKALHHCISSAAALMNWHSAIRLDESGAGIGKDEDIAPDGSKIEPIDAALKSSA